MFKVVDGLSWIMYNFLETVGDPHAGEQRVFQHTLSLCLGGDAVPWAVRG